ncbi:MAG: TAXI family TRAP transporter solute-binding subunit [Deltaproteobacteria bacterium]|jgi:TRAP transporter TAXI family solute receptor|nr:TAXI family TRAP transporter solute-binding subunit [Deltaproteobacteria bacterium]MBW2533891.1 TAXI family TRAP transporter solute-binding subunit [Deltaproteobacteria bacterium]
MNRRTLYVSFGVAILAVIAVVLLAWFGVYGRTEKLRLAAGTSGSSIHDLGAALAEVFNTKVDDVQVEVVEAKAVRNSLETILKGEADLAVAFSDSQGDGDIRTLVPLYELYLYIVVWHDETITDVPSLMGKRIGLGPDGSGTDALARRLLEHYAFDGKDANLVNASYRDTTKLFKNQELDAVFILGSTESKAVEKMLAVEGTELLSLDDPERVAPAMDGIRSNNPYVVSHVIPKHLFGAKPVKPTGVIGVNALLVARADLPEEPVRRLTEAVFQHKVALGQKIPKLREIDEHFDRSQLRFPLHPGAAQYYRRDEPPAILEWADTISLFITLLVLGWSGVLAIAARRRQKQKGILDELYREFQQVAYKSDDHTADEELQESHDRLQELRRKAFEALMEGRIEANSAFVVFHDYLRAELSEIDRIQRDRKRAPRPAAEPS